MKITFDADQLPIPDWGLVCPDCSYPLRGLPEHRCPECGAFFRPAELIRSWHRLRDPEFDGTERPLPEFGLLCGACDRGLAGATRSECPHCGTVFDFAAIWPREPWFSLTAKLCAGLPIALAIRVCDAQLIPYAIRERSSIDRALFGQTATGTPGIVFVPSEFFLDFRYYIESEARDVANRRLHAWRCEKCDETAPGTFDFCWNCGEPRGRDG